MPLTAVDVPAPAHLVAVEAGDADGDGRDDLVLVSTTAAGDEPDRVTLTVLRVGPDGKVASTTKVDLGNRAAYWTLAQGLWVVDGEGLSRIQPDTGASTRVVAQRTVVAGLGVSTPAHADLGADLDGDGRTELLVPCPGRLVVVEPDGTAFGSVPLHNERELGSDAHLGGVALALTVRPASWTVADMDGDGKKDLLFPSHKTLTVWYTGAVAGERSVTTVLPLDLEPPPEPLRPGTEQKRIASVWFRDVDGDHKADLVVHRWVTNGGFFGATAEILWALGNGAGFGPGFPIRTAAAAFGVELLDIDGDGDLDLITREADVGFGNLARALVQKAIRVTLNDYPSTNHVYPIVGTAIRGYSFPIDPPNRYQDVWSGDVDGDGRLDLVTNDAQDAVRVYRGQPKGLDDGPAWTVPVPVPLDDNPLLVHDLNGDGKAEIVVWGHDERTVRLLSLQ